MITNIQMLRAYAAIMVVFYHTNFRIQGLLHTDFQGVAIFFVVSGFIMTYITSKDTGESSPKSFLLHRTVRIVPLYWSCTILLIVLANLGALNLPVLVPQLATMIYNNPAEIIDWAKSAFDIGNRIRIDEIVKSLLFIPYLDRNGDLHPVLGVAWTLNMEMSFYLCFAIMLFAGKKLAPLLTLVCIVIACLFAPLLVKYELLKKIYPVDYIACFGAGIGLFYIWKAFESHNRYRLVIRSGIIAITSVGMFFYFRSNLCPWPLAHVPLPAPWLTATSVVMLALVLHSWNFRISSRIIIFLSATSYSLYLTHTIILEILRTLTPASPVFDFQTSVSGVAIAITSSLLFGSLIHLTIEKPSISVLRKRFFFPSPKP